MESRDYIRPLLALLVGIGLVVLVVVLLIKAFVGAPAAPSSQTNITKYANTAASVTLLVDAPTGIDQDHRQVKITVSAAQNEIDIMQGYQGTIMSSQTYPNNTTAFSVFLQTLELMDFSKGKLLPGVSYTGYCPTGDRYVFTFNNGEKNVFSYWATSCGGQGTFQGKLGPVLEQFERQIPAAQFGPLTNDIALGF